MNESKQGFRRTLFGFLLGAVLAPLIVFLFWGSFAIGVGQGRPLSAFGIPFLAVLPDMVAAVGSAETAALIQSALGGLFGAIVATATLPFADDGPELVRRSLLHFTATTLSFGLLLWVCRWAKAILLYLFLLAILYLLIWLGRWIGWYVEVAQLRILLGLDPGPSPLKWKETLPYLPFVLLVGTGLPLVLRWVERLLGGGDVPVFTGLIYPFFILPVAGFCSGLSLGKRQGVCLLYPLACFLCYLPIVFLLFNSSALFHCFLVAIPALMGNVLGWLYRRAVPKQR